ncbi:hypothetical protein B0H67DRAFT_559037 [Lasiosphaeris hirsuta]|uniref:Uncharacterized protein n=1 Tax=Lasiosphaeris hirsuta TaxID=260670 RepID=A0AA40B8E3_9PEZI|nr:hypothetical protein B0H67DRAFT_559037 [Lasiosphaeris hirsuta]
METKEGGSPNSEPVEALRRYSSGANPIRRVNAPSIALQTPLHPWVSLCPARIKKEPIARPSHHWHPPTCRSGFNLEQVSHETVVFHCVLNWTSSRRMAGGKHSKNVAVLDMRRNTFSLRDRAEAEQLNSQMKVNLPRFKGSVDIYIPEADQDQEEYLATVRVWRLGFGYNLHRILGWKKQLWVLPQ